MLQNCKTCDQEFEARANRKYCKRLLEKICLNCNTVFTYECNKRPVKACSKDCATILTHNPTKETKTCKNCYTRFTGKQSALYCREEKNLACKLCAREFLRTCTLGGKQFDYCDSICWNLAKGSINKTRALEYREINNWALRFTEERQRKPSLQDYQAYFNLRNLPSFANRSLFELSRNRRSWIEQQALKTIKDSFPGLTIEIHKRPLSYSSRRLEIDFLIPELKLGIEIQDFATHSIDQDNEYSRFNELKKGPVYHNLKKALTKEQLGFILIELWEDEIRLDYTFNSLQNFLDKSSLNK